MDLIVLDQNLEPLCVMDSYESLIWTDRYWEYGDFEIYTPMSANVASNIKQGYYLQNPESEHLMIIEHLLVNSDYEEGNYVTISGRSLESILDRRIIWGLKMLNGNLQNEIESLINSCIIAPSNKDRKIENFIFEYSTDVAITNLNIKAQYTGDNLYDVVSQICKERNIGFKITLNSNRQFVFSLYSGADRSYKQTVNPVVVFSPNFDNLASSNYIESKAKWKNVALIGGEGEGYDRRYATLGGSSGLERRELFVDARDISSEINDGQTLSEEEYVMQLGQRGQEKLNECTDITSFEGEAEINMTFKYKEDFFLGDVVQVADEYNHSARSRVLEVVISESKEGFQIYSTFKAVDEQGNNNSAEKDVISGSGIGKFRQIEERIDEVQASLADHTHAASDITSGSLPITHGGTGATTVAAARDKLGLGNTSGALPVANGGTGATTAANARTNLGITLANLGAAASSHNHSADNITSGTIGASRLPMGWKKATISFSNGVGSVSCKGITASSSVLAMRGGSYSDTSGNYSFLGAAASTSGTAKVFTGVGSASPSSWTVYLWWSK